MVEVERAVAYSKYPIDEEGLYAFCEEEQRSEDERAQRAQGESRQAEGELRRVGDEMDGTGNELDRAEGELDTPVEEEGEARRGGYLAFRGVTEFWGCTREAGDMSAEEKLFMSMWERVSSACDRYRMRMLPCVEGTVREFEGSIEERVEQELAEELRGELEEE